MPIDIKYDGDIDIALGRNRHETNWRNKVMPWSGILERISVTHRTAESFKEYLASKKPRQDEIKDSNGAFVGGYLRGGKRGKGTVNYRHLVTLDIDFATPDTWDDFKMLYPCAAATYSTHKHTPDKPRLRLLVPLDRHVLPDEYVAIARRIAGDVGIEYFDDTTYQPERLMYWPSTSKDGVYTWDYVDGPWLCADDVLATYRDWRDSSEWPVSERVGEVLHRAMKKQGDPLEKPGVVGAFCRTYTIHEAIDLFLSDVYEPCDVEGRYTFLGGSTSAGLVTYEDKFAFSHHGTDPTSMQLCNAFDLVRIHMYGLRDENVSSNTPINKTPSYIAMEDLARKDKKVCKLIVGERLRSAAEDFADIAVEDDTVTDTETEVDDSWMGRLECDRKSNILSTVANAVIIMENAPELKGRFAYDEFRKRPVLLRNPPWRKVTHATQWVTDTDENVLYHHLEKNYKVNATKMDKILSVVYNRNTFHPVLDYLAGLKWDRKPRAEALFIDYLGAEDTPYTRAVTRKMLTGAVARMKEPGIKFDNVLTLIGEEGLLKSTIFKKLGGEWFTDNFSFNMIKDSKGIEQLQGYWIVEVPEMGGFRKADRNEVKAFISRSVDVHRPAYGRNTMILPRQSIIVSTSNEHDPLHENEGNRRVWPVPIYVSAPKHSVRDLTPEIVGQIWAEALAWYAAGETVYLSPDMEKVARQVQRRHTEEHPWTGVVRRYLDTRLPEDWPEKDIYERRAWLQSGEDPLPPAGTVMRERVCVNELWAEALGRQEKDLTVSIAKDLHGIMRSMQGWAASDQQLRYGVYGPQRRGYVRVTDYAERPVLIKEQSKN